MSPESEKSGVNHKTHYGESSESEELPGWAIRLAENPVSRWAILILFGPLMANGEWVGPTGHVDRTQITAFFLGCLFWLGVGYAVVTAV